MDVCPTCGSSDIHRSRTITRAERRRKTRTAERLHRCHACGWRGWGPASYRQEAAVDLRVLGGGNGNDGLMPDVLWPPGGASASPDSRDIVLEQLDVEAMLGPRREPSGSAPPDDLSDLGRTLAESAARPGVAPGARVVAGREAPRARSARRYRSGARRRQTARPAIVERRIQVLLVIGAVLVAVALLLRTC